MALIQCPECNNQISSAATGCPHCGFPIAEYRRQQAQQKQAIEQQAAEEAKRKQQSIGCLAILGFCGLCALFGMAMDACESWKAERQAEEERIAEQERIDDLRNNLSEYLNDVDQMLAEGNLGGANSLLSDLEEVEGQSEEVQQRRTAYIPLYREQQLPLIDAALDESDLSRAQSLIEELERWDPENEEIQQRRNTYTELNRQSIAQSRLADARSRLGTGREQMEADEWISAEESFSRALADLDDVHEDHWIDDHGSVKRELEQALSRAEPRAETERERIAEEEAYRALCGTKPSQSSWDGHVGPVRTYLRRAAHDPGSIDFEGCTEPVLTSDNCWRTTCNYRGKNAFGALIRNSGTFYIRASSPGNRADTVFRVD